MGKTVEEERGALACFLPSVLVEGESYPTEDLQST